MDDETTMLLITHIGADAELGTRVGLIKGGGIISVDTPEGLKTESRFFLYSKYVWEKA